MSFPRSAGILLHVTSLPGPHGIGDLGNEAHQFLSLLAQAGQTVWQVLPVGPTGWGNSPYQSPSAFAGNPLLIDLRTLRDGGLLTAHDLADSPRFSAVSVDYDAVAAWKANRLALACQRFQGPAGQPFREACQQFCQRNAAWLDDYALFMALKEAQGGREWTAWRSELVRRDPASLASAAYELRQQVERHRVQQFLFFQQWAALRAAAHRHGVRILGDLPIFVAHDSADVWANQELFSLDECGHTTVVAGVPPDYFSSTGQRWGNPLYRWEALRDRGYAWWIQRLGWSFQLFDQVRIDHFRGFEAYWEIPGAETTAVKGRWIPGPGVAFFQAIEKALGRLEMVAEDLGLITPAVSQLRQDAGLPGMRVLQFAFGEDSGAEHRPYSYCHDCVAYTGTHDNDTAVGWFRQKPGRQHSARTLAAERQYALRFLNSDGHEFHWDMIRAVHSSVAGLAMVPMQDVLGLGSKARMNTPGTGVNNWVWRMKAGALKEQMIDRLRDLTDVYGRTLAAPAAMLSEASNGPQTSAA